MNTADLSPGTIKDNISGRKFAEGEIVSLLRRMDLPEDIIKRIVANPDWISKHKIQAGVVNHPNTPRVTAVKFVKYLFWKELVDVLNNLRVSPMVRRTAENVLKDRLQDMALGEKMQLAKMPSRGVVKALRRSSNKMVIKNLLINPVLTEEDVLFIINRNTTTGPMLESIGRSPKWRNRYQIKMELIKNPRTPVQLCVNMLTGMMIRDLQALVGLPAVHRTVKTAAKKMIDKKKAPFDNSKTMK